MNNILLLILTLGSWLAFFFFRRDYRLKLQAKLEAETIKVLAREEIKQVKLLQRTKEKRLQLEALRQEYETTQKNQVDESKHAGRTTID